MGFYLGIIQNIILKTHYIYIPISNNNLRFKKPILIKNIYFTIKILNINLIRLTVHVLMKTLIHNL